MSELSFTCPFCERTSFNPNDVRFRYCGACHRFYPERDESTTELALAWLEEDARQERKRDERLRKRP